MTWLTFDLVFISRLDLSWTISETSGTAVAWRYVTAETWRFIIYNFVFITGRKRSLGQGNIFAPVCHSVHTGGVPGQVHPRAGTPTRQVHSPRQVPPRQVPPGQIPPSKAGTHPPGRYPPGRYTPLGRYTPWAGTPQAGTPPGRYTPPWQVPPGQVYPPWQVLPGRYTPWEQCMLGDTGSKWAVCILVECILVTE